MGKYNVRIDNVSVEAVFNRLGGVEGARRFLRGELKLVEEEPLLSFVRTFQTTSNQPTIAWGSDQFKGWFDGVEFGERAKELTLYKLERQSSDTSIVTALGGEKAAEISWASFEAALAEKERTDDLTWLLAYVKDKDDILRSVSAYWLDGGCSVEAYSLGRHVGLDAGYQVLSRTGPL